MSEDSPRVRHVVGCMTGTSLDGLDAALVRITGTGLDMTAEFVGMVSAPLPDALRTTLLSMANGESHPPIEFMRAARYLGVVHAEAVAQLLSTHASDLKPDFIVAHGQTIWHAPPDRLSWQLFDPWPIVRALQLPVCYDLRQADLVAGGEGAPITPITDWVMYRKPGKKRCVLNLGGIANITVLPSNGMITDVMAEDVGPCNLLIDQAVRLLHPHESMDRDGKFSRDISTISTVFYEIRKAPFFSRPRPRTTGREDFDMEWLRDVARKSEANADCWVASVVEAAARLALAELGLEDGDELILAGGGTRNPTLLKNIRDRATRWGDRQVAVGTSDEFGIPCEAREAMGFAVLGALSQDGVPITLPQVTGAETPGVAGVWAYPDGSSA
ncbi:anhydro-N-acetylmuramic acid kinase [Algisphaera agarilytica]|uniref:Anhydro-N-acetylmuramic acid kinase n=1 Tax=Algisphaera agarilytica TaxID=1385975 RepID=A0A7X0H5P7_9BACT|nr:anhydro-N-acetylmuramic acid kinase [Algisphaera agarilytica]MBB6429725.1 anhydro-N-acetylmuramic acid kinase [Algisphaera agarilytica]